MQPRFRGHGDRKPMMRLLEKGLIFAELFPVDTPAMVARYNEALKKLTGKQTKLTEFMVDISGFAPEIADELEDPFYLNPHGVNRQFILACRPSRRPARF